jgi:hypothetical protein
MTTIHHRISTWNGSMAGHINNRTSTDDEINFWLALVKQLLVVDTLARGSSLSISPQNDSEGNVIGCTFTITYESDTSMSFFPDLIAPVTTSIYMDLLDNTLWHGQTGRAITSGELAPIVAMELNIVGHLDGSDTHFTSGAGTINYISRHRSLLSRMENLTLRILGATQLRHRMTYGQLPAGYTSTHTQSFRADTLLHLRPGIGDRKGAPLATKRPLNPADSSKNSS